MEHSPLWTSAGQVAGGHVPALPVLSAAAARCLWDRLACSRGIPWQFSVPALRLCRGASLAGSSGPSGTATIRGMSFAFVRAGPLSASFSRGFPQSVCLRRMHLAGDDRSCCHGRSQERTAHVISVSQKTPVSGGDLRQFVAFWG